MPILLTVIVQNIGLNCVVTSGSAPSEVLKFFSGSFLEKWAVTDNSRADVIVNAVLGCVLVPYVRCLVNFFFLGGGGMPEMICET